MPARKYRSDIGLESLITLSVFAVEILAGTVGLSAVTKRSPRPMHCSHYSGLRASH